LVGPLRGGPTIASIAHQAGAPLSLESAVRENEVGSARIRWS
jgi:hypothetical protein